MFAPLATTRPDGDRRRFLDATACGLALAVCGLLRVAPTPAAEAEALRAPSFDAALDALGGTPVASDRIALTLPSRIEDGAVVPIKLHAEMERVSAVYVLASVNPVALAVGFRLPPGTDPTVSTRIKLNGSGPVYALARADDKLFWTARDAVVVRGGCS